ncbi:Uncharacterized membrane protein YhaH, DUF805 family [Tranquillimonas rosea]|uniref:Uncharacterized membrane protein YhaH, DUF805 family n=1 Tax=Tranquillimonas rosea TaxID=641238 RepID=A0A1H9SD91_9RHOB|nr:DUF805 domain-containing protein [Tranquillimonas rosea]SER82931.1 Uncharacterized membrane protein YhaH, DUF805 family [Tranquillimonas rosea]
MTPQQAIRTCLRKYATFSGRAPRPEYWWFFLFILVGNIVTGWIDMALFGTATAPDGGQEGTSPAIVSAIFSLATLIPSLAAGWRRMHDTGRSGLYLLYPLIVMVGLGTFGALMGMLGPVLGDGAIPSGLAGIGFAIGIFVFLISPLLVLWWLARPSQPGPNDYGPNPREVTP